MTFTQQVITIILMATCVVLTRTLPFVLFWDKNKIPHFVLFLEKYLAGAVFGMLVVYCLKDVTFATGNHGLPQLIAITACILLHLWKKNLLLTIAGGTIVYMIIVQNLV